MESSTINAIISKARDLDAYDKLVIVDDNYHMYYVKSESMCGYFDNGNKVFVSFAKNNNPIQDTMREPKFMIEWVDYDHITSIYLKTPIKISADVGMFDFDEDTVKAIIKKNGGTFQAAGLLYKKGGEENPSGIYPELQLGVPYEAVKVTPINNEEESGNDQPDSNIEPSTEG